MFSQRSTANCSVAAPTQLWLDADGRLASGHGAYAAGSSEGREVAVGLPACCTGTPGCCPGRRCG